MSARHKRFRLTVLPHPGWSWCLYKACIEYGAFVVSTWRLHREWWYYGARTNITQYMMTSSTGNILRVTGHLCRQFTGPRWIARTGLYILSDLRLNKRKSRQSSGWWFETLSGPLWRHCNDMIKSWYPYDVIAEHDDVVVSVGKLIRAWWSYGDCTNLRRNDNVKVYVGKLYRT